MLVHHFASAQKPSRAVVLGAGGFVGAATTQSLRTLGVPTLALGRKELDLLAPDAAETLTALLQPGDAVVFVSAKAPVKNPAMLLENLRMAEAVCSALSRKIPAHVVYVSSDAVYKDSPGPLTEESCAEPGSLHGVMHLAREVMLRATFAGPLALIRPTLIYGLNDPHNGYGPNRFRRLAAEAREIVLFGEGEERRDHVSVNDVAELIVRTVLHRSAGVLNAVSGQVVSFRETAEYTNALLGGRSIIKGSPRTGPMPHDGYRPFDPAAIIQSFPDFVITSWKKGLADVVHPAKSS